MYFTRNQGDTDLKGAGIYNWVDMLEQCLQGSLFIDRES